MRISDWSSDVCSSDLSGCSDGGNVLLPFCRVPRAARSIEAFVASLFANWAEPSSFRSRNDGIQIGTRLRIAGSEIVPEDSMKTQAVVVADDQVYLTCLENSPSRNAEFYLIPPPAPEGL